MCKEIMLKIKLISIVALFVGSAYCMEPDEVLEGREGLKARLEFVKQEAKRLQAVNAQNQGQNPIAEEASLQEKILVKLLEKILQMQAQKMAIEAQMARSTEDDTPFLEQIAQLESDELRLLVIAEQLKDRIFVSIEGQDQALEPVVPTYIQRDLNFEQQYILRAADFPAECILAQRGNLLQLNVLNQFWQNCGGGASCGYQALKNGIVIARLIHSDLAQRMQLLYELTSISLVQALFGKVGSDWRASVIKSRRRSIIVQVISNILHLRLLGCEHITDPRVRGENIFALNYNKGSVTYLPFTPEEIALENFDQEREAYRSCIGTVAELLANNMPIEAQQATNISVTTQEIIAAFNDALEFKGRDDYRYQEPADLRRRALYNALRANPDKIGQYFPEIADIQIIVNNNGIMEPSTRMAGSFAEGFLPGEWLTSDEVNPLITRERASAFLNGIWQNVRILCVGDQGQGSLANQLRNADLYAGGVQVFAPHMTGHDTDNLYQREFIDEDVQHFADSIRGTQGQLPFVGIIILCVPGHWITIVVNKIHGEIQYILADSVGASRINDARVSELIALLEGRQINRNSGCVIL